MATAEAFDVVEGRETTRWIREFDARGHLVSERNYHRGEVTEERLWVYDETGMPVTLTSTYDGWYEVVEYDEDGLPWRSHAYSVDGELLGGTEAHVERTKWFRGYTQYDSSWRPVHEVAGVFDEAGVLREIVEYGPDRYVIARVEQVYGPDDALVAQRFFDGEGNLTADIPTAYDEDGRLVRGVSIRYSEITESVGGSHYLYPVAATYRYDEHGIPVLAVDFDPATGLLLDVATVRCDEASRVCVETEVHISYDYDAAGDIAARTPAPHDDSITVTRYELDALGQLLREEVVASSGLVRVTEYDEHRNQTRVVEYNPTRGRDSGRVMRVETDFEYDDFGNWTGSTTRRARLDATLPEQIPAAMVIEEVMRLTQSSIDELDEPEVMMQRFTYRGDP